MNSWITMLHKETLPSPKLLVFSHSRSTEQEQTTESEAASVYIALGGTPVTSQLALFFKILLIWQVFLYCVVHLSREVVFVESLFLGWGR